MMITVVLDGQFDVFPAHIEHGDKLPIAAVHRDLGLWRREPRANKEKTQPRFAWRLGTGIDESQCHARTRDAAATAVTLG